MKKVLRNIVQPKVAFSIYLNSCEMKPLCSFKIDTATPTTTTRPSDGLVLYGASNDEEWSSFALLLHTRSKTDACAFLWVYLFSSLASRVQSQLLLLWSKPQLFSWLIHYCAFFWKKTCILCAKDIFCTTWSAETKLSPLAFHVP
jgi:hypothetical protein